MRSLFVVFFLLDLDLSRALPLPKCTVAVAGANGRVGSMVCRELLRHYPSIRVCALVRSVSDPYQGYGRLSYEVGAEEGKATISAAWKLDEETGRFLSPAKVEFDPEVQGSYGLERLDIRECDLRVQKDVEEALSDVDGVIFCASSFDSFRQRLPDRLDGAASKIANAGMALFELRFGDALFGRAGSDQSEARAREVRGKTADVEGLQNVVSTLSSSRKRRERIAMLSGKSPSEVNKLAVPLVVASAADFVGYEQALFSEQLQETEFGFRKRTADELVRSSELPHLIVHAPLIDESLEEGLEVLTERRVARLPATANTANQPDQAVGVRRDEARNRRIHPRDLATFLASCLDSPAAADDPVGSSTLEVWTSVRGN